MRGFVFVAVLLALGARGAGAVSAAPRPLLRQPATFSRLKARLGLGAQGLLRRVFRGVARPQVALRRLGRGVALASMALALSACMTISVPVDGARVPDKASAGLVIPADKLPVGWQRELRDLQRAHEADPPQLQAPGSASGATR